MLLWDIFGKFPGTDYESFNYDWVIGKLKELKDSVAAALASEQAAAESAEEAHGNLVVATIQATRAETAARNSANSAAESAASAASIAGVVNQVNTNTSRIDNLIANAGDGTVPSELVDIRVGFDAETYTTAGDAVRDQSQRASIYAKKQIVEHDGYISPSGTFPPADTSAQEKYSDIYPVTEGSVLTFAQTFQQIRQTWVALGLYKTDGTWDQRYVLVNSVNQQNVWATYTVPSGISGVRISYRTYGEAINDLHIYTQFDKEYPSHADVLEYLKKDKYGLGDPLLIPNGAKIAAHRGAMMEAPENTIPAFELAAQQGAWAIETDIFETTDGRFVCFHDQTVDRMTDGTGNIAQMSFTEVQALTIDSGANIQNYPNLKIPTFEEYLGLCKKYSCVPLIEIKHVAHFTDLLDIVKKYGLDKSVIYIMAGTNVINNMKNVGCNNIIGWVRDAGYDLDDALTTVQGYENCTIDIGVPDANITFDEVAKYHAANLPFMIWNCNSLSDVQRFAEMGVDIITSSSIMSIE